MIMVPVSLFRRLSAPLLAVILLSFLPLPAQAGHHKRSARHIARKVPARHASATPVSVEPAEGEISKLLHPGPVLAPSYILVDVDTGRVLAQRNAHQRMFPASTTKTMTALVALEQGNLDSMITIGPNPVATGESSLNLLLGETFSLRELISAALIKSANDSCVAIAEGVAGSVPEFVALMNRKARELGANDTHFVNPHGLHDKDHYSSAYDLSLIARAALQNPTFNEIINTRQLAIHGNVKVGPQRLLTNRNRLLFRWNECDGVKTGYTRQAGRCLIASATHTDPATGRRWRLLSVVLHAPDSWSDSYNLITQEGFKKYQPNVFAHAGDSLATGPVRNGSGNVTAIAAADAAVPLLPGEASRLTGTPHLRKLQAPIAQGARIGNYVLLLDGRKIGFVPLIASADVPVGITTRIATLALPLWPLRGERGRLAAVGTAALLAAMLLVWRRIRMDSRARRYAAHGRRRPPQQTRRPAEPHRAAEARRPAEARRAGDSRRQGDPRRSGGTRQTR